MNDGTDAFASLAPLAARAQYEDKFKEHNVTGEALLKLDDDRLQEMVPDLTKKIGRRKKLMARVKPLRLGFLAWSVDDAIKWLGVHNLLMMTEVFREVRRAADSPTPARPLPRLV